MKKLLTLIPLGLAAAMLPATQTMAAPVDDTGKGGGQSTAARVPTRSTGDSTATDKQKADAVATESDVEAIARQTDRPVKEVATKIAWQDRVKAEAQRLAETYPDTFTGVRIVSHAKQEVWLGFKGKAPDVKLPEGSEATVADDQPMNAAELEQAASRLAGAAKSTFDAEASAVPDMTTATIDVWLRWQSLTSAAREVWRRWSFPSGCSVRGS